MFRYALGRSRSLSGYTDGTAKLKRLLPFIFSLLAVTKSEKQIYDFVFVRLWMATARAAPPSDRKSSPNSECSMCRYALGRSRSLSGYTDGTAKLKRLLPFIFSLLAVTKSEKRIYDFVCYENRSS